MKDRAAYERAVEALRAETEAIRAATPSEPEPGSLLWQWDNASPAERQKMARQVERGFEQALREENRRAIGETT